jgi:cyanophycinase
MSRFVELAGGKGKARIAVLPMASAEPESAGKEQADELRALGAASAEAVILTRDQALTAGSAARLDGITGVFFSGGDQNRLTAVLLGTPTLERLKQLYASGAAIGGTSAGAAVMTDLMITGDEVLNPDPKDSFVIIKKGNVKLAEGFGFLSGSIVDQHFVRRKRSNRLLSVVLEHPDLLGIGIDEVTAIIVAAGRSFEVLGEGTVLVYDARDASAVRVGPNGNLSGRNLRLHLLVSGDTFPLVPPH